MDILKLISWLGPALQLMVRSLEKLEVSPRLGDEALAVGISLSEFVAATA
jgi:hypothetical protein